MFGLWGKRNKKSSEKDFRKIVKQEMIENKEVLESLRDYDAGKKDISTAAIERRLRNI